jgi:hypothetical protein
MCDYSLQHVASTPAKVGDKLMTTQFASACTRGFSAIGRPDVAVCLPSGAELAFDDEVSTVFGAFAFRLVDLLIRRKSHGRVARFRQVNMDRPNVHHDALEFPDGPIVMVTYLRPGQRATVLQLPPVRQARDDHAAFAPSRVERALTLDQA